MELLVPIAILVVMWLTLIRPQQRRVREHQAYVASVSLGEDVITTSGIYGTIVGLDDERARLSIAPGVEITIARGAIGRPQAALAAGEPPTPDADE